MRMMTGASCLLAVMGCLGLGACSANEPAPETSSGNPDVELIAKAEGPNGDLTMKGSPEDPDYVGVYPNPQKLDSVSFVLRADGVPLTLGVKDGVAMLITETPFFVNVKTKPVATSGGVAVRAIGVPSTPPPSEPTPDAKESSPDTSGAGASSSGSAPAPSTAPAPAGGAMAGGVTVEVTDVNGKVVAKKEVGTPAPAPAPATSGGSAPLPTGSTCGGATMEGSPGRGGASKSAETRACQSASLADAPGCDMTTVAAAAKVYCDAVNAQLPAADKIDCATMTSAYAPSPLPATRTGGDCSTYWEPARSAVDAAGFGSCEKVKLLLTQWRDRSRHELIANGVCTSSPLILDLDGDGIHLSSLADGVSFDLLGGGRKVQAAWTDGKDAFLALDRNGNGQIDGAAELFGNATAGDAFDDGFTALAELDDDGNGAIDARDRAYGHLLVWRDANRDGVSTPQELVTLSAAGVKRLSILAVRRSGPSSLDAHGNSIPLVTEFERTDGTRGALVDAFLRFRPTR